MRLSKNLNPTTALSDSERQPRSRRRPVNSVCPTWVFFLYIFLLFPGRALRTRACADGSAQANNARTGARSREVLPRPRRVRTRRNRLLDFCLKKKPQKFAFAIHNTRKWAGNRLPVDRWEVEGWTSLERSRFRFFAIPLFLTMG